MASRKKSYLRSKKACFLLSAVLAATALPARDNEAGLESGEPPAPSILWHGLAPGDHGIGFTVLEIWDRSRGFGDLEARPIQLSLWYPARTAAESPRMRYREYVHLFERPRPRLFVQPSPQQFLEIETRWGAEYPEDLRRRWLAAPTAAVRDAPPLDGPFPAIFYAPGFGASPVSHTVTAEYLASHGYVVAASPSLGAGPEGMTFDSPGLETQVRDIEFGLAQVRERPEVLGGQAGVVGFSFGGAAALLVAMRSPGIGAVVSLDGSVNDAAAFDLIRATPGYLPDRLQSPLLQIDSLDGPSSDQSLVRELRLAPRYRLGVRGAEHLDFIPKSTMRHAAGGEASPHQLAIYRSGVQYLRRFLDVHLRGDAALASLEQKPADPRLAAGAWEVLTILPGDGEILEREPCGWPSFTSHREWYEFMKEGIPHLDDRIFETHFSEAAYERYRAARDVRCEKIVYGSDGLRVVGYLVQPADLEPSRPAVIYNRGGYGEYGRILFWDRFQMLDLAARGYVVVAGEYRGNWGGEGHDEGGGADVADVLNLLSLVDRLPGADGERIGMMGWSRGGGMTYQTLARTDRIDAAIIIAGPTDAFDFARRRPEAAAAVEPEMFATHDVARERLERSPLRWPERLHRGTPILLLHGSADWRVHPGQALAMASRLFELQHPVRFVLFEGGDHLLNEHFSEAWEQIVDWLDRYVRDRKPWPSLEPHGN